MLFKEACNFITNVFAAKKDMRFKAIAGDAFRV